MQGTTRTTTWPGAPPPLDRRRPDRVLALRVLLWRARYVLPAVALAIAAAVVLRELRPPPPVTVAQVVAARDVPAGALLTAADLRVARLPEGLVVADGFAEVDDLVGTGTAVPVPAGLPIVPGVLAAGDVAGPPGTVVASVRLADPAVADLLAPGARVDVLAASPETGQEGVVVASRALVLPFPAAAAEEGGGGLGLGTIGGGQDASPVLLAVRPAEAPALAGAAASALLSVVVVP